MSRVMENGRPLAGYRYNEDGTVRSLTLGSSLYTEYTYDMDKNLSRMWTRLGEDTLLVDNSYQYDGNGNRTQKQTQDGLTRYAYDANNRLVEVAYPGMNGVTDTEYLHYDHAGNRTERIRGNVHEYYHYDACNRLTEITDGIRQVKHYTYDNSGNMLSDGEMSYLYDGFGRLEQVTKADGSFQKNHYDAEGLRAEMEENGQLVKFLYNENREAVAEEESDGNVIRYIRGLGLISSDSEKAKTYYHYVSDEQGSITHVINGEEKESGELPQEDVQSRVLNHYEYDAFGNTIRCEEQVHNRFRYTGEQYDPLTGQYYLRARYYNPVIARFTQEDTYYGDGLNLYTYCQNNPVLYHDPTGHGTKENSPYSRKEQQYIDAGADPDTARLAAECYPDANSKQDLYNKYKSQGYNATDAKKLANYEIVHGEERAKNYAANNVKKSGPDYTATSPRDNVNTDWRTQNRLNAQREAGAGKSGSSSGKVWDYAKQFDGELSNFNDGYEIKNVIDEDLCLVQFHSNAEVGNGRSLKYWTTFDEANGISTVDDYMNKMALLSNWGARDNVSIAKIPAGTKIKYAIGTAKEQVGAIESRPGGGLQILFEQFDDGWVLDTRPLS